jgi:hypothetical protein
MLAKMRDGRDEDLGRQIRQHRHRRRLPQHRASAIRHGLWRVREAVLDAAAYREERAARARGAAILREIADLDVARQLRETIEQSCEAARARGRRVHRVATWRATPRPGPPSPTGASGGTASSRSAPPTTPENTGAATSPP